MDAPVFTSADYQYMSLALQLAEKGCCTTMPNPAVGCVIVKADKIIGEGWHETAGEAHAEIRALAQAGDDARASTAYITLEPCCHHGRTPPCTVSLIAAGIARVVVAMQDPNPKVAGQGIKELIATGIDVQCGLLQAQAERLNKAFSFRMRHGRPYVRCKLAMSIDGRTALASGESKWITSGAAREDVQRLRASSSSIMTGRDTVVMDDPSLTVRSGRVVQNRQPLRVILDSQLRTPATARLFSQPGNTLIFTLQQDAVLEKALIQSGAAVYRVAADNDLLNLNAVMRKLAELEINDVLLEAGATLSGAMLRAGLIDEFIIYMAPILMGDAARGLFSLPGLDTMDSRVKLHINDIRAVGDDWRINALPIRDGYRV